MRAIIGLGTGLGVTVTAEGVETEAELACLRAEGCNEAQGFLFSKARPNGEIVATMKARLVAKSMIPKNGSRFSARIMLKIERCGVSVRIMCASFSAAGTC